MSAALAALAGILIALGVRELWAERGESVRCRIARAARSLPLTADPIGGAKLRARIAAAGLAGRLDPRAVLASRVVAATAAAPLSPPLASVAPGRTAPLLLAGIPLAAAALPDLVLQRLALRRRERIARALPDVLDLMATAAGSGKGAGALLAEAAAAGAGPLREELSAAAADLECGRPQRDVLRGLAADGGAQLGSLSLLLERSRTLGVPLAAGLTAQASSLRDEQERRLEEQGARAAPKIQLVVALLLVPSVLLVVGAAAVANADLLLGGL